MLSKVWWTARPKTGASTVILSRNKYNSYSRSDALAPEKDFAECRWLCLVFFYTLSKEIQSVKKNIRKISKEIHSLKEFWHMSPSLMELEQSPSLLSAACKIIRQFCFLIFWRKFFRRRYFFPAIIFSFSLSDAYFNMYFKRISKFWKMLNKILAGISWHFIDSRSCFMENTTFLSRM